MKKYDIQMKAVNPFITEHGFTPAGSEWYDIHGRQWYKKELPQNFRGRYMLYLCENDIAGLYLGISTQDHDLSSLLEKLAFRTPEAVAVTKTMLLDLKAKGVIDFDIVTWPEEGGAEEC